MNDSENSPRFSATWRADFGASVVVFLVALPLCMGVAIASGMPVAAGLISGIVGGMIVGWLAGSPLQVSGPAAGLTVMVFQFIEEFGIERVGIVVLACGVFQILFGVLRLGMWFRAVSPAVVHGMLAGIGVLIFASQFHVMVDDKPRGTGWQNLLTIPQAVAKSFPPPALETAEERAAVRSRILRLGQLHQRQMELKEEVHHALSAFGPEQATQANPAAGPTGGGGGDMDDEWDADDETVDEDARTGAGEALRGLFTRQKEVLDELAAIRAELPLGRLQGGIPAAVDATRRAAETLERGEVDSARGAIDGAEAAVRFARDTTKHHRWAATLGILTIVLLVGWQALVTPRLKAVPAALVAICCAAAAANLWQLPVSFVEVPASLAEEVFLPNWGELRAILEPRMLLYGLEFALIASAETLLCATAVDQMHRGARTNYDRELLAQGLGNAICGLLRALPISGVIVRSTVNVGSGAKSRLSSVLHGAWILLFVVALSALLARIPTSALAALLVYTGYHLINFKGLARLWRQNRFEAIVFAGTALGIVFFGLLEGVALGLAMSIARLLYEFSQLEIEVEEGDLPGEKTLRLKGNATFLSLPRLADALDELPPETELTLDVEYVDYLDHACRALLENRRRECETAGGRLELNQQSLEARFWRRPRERGARRQGEIASHRGRRERQVPI